jgi:hypothetical protein
VTTKNYLLFVLFLLSGITLSAQKTEEELPPPPNSPCGTHEMSPWLLWFRAHKEELTAGRDVDTTWLYVPVTIHIVGDNAGNGFHPQDLCMRIMCEMNEQYAPAYIRFYLLPGQSFVYHSNSTWNDHDWDGGDDLINSTRIDGRLNAYIVADPAGNCGYSWQDAIVMSRSCSGAGNSTWAHEAGHHFSLPHPFYGWEGEDWDYSQPAPNQFWGQLVEKMDGSNCYDAGDGFCDTPPDYLNYRWPCDTNQLSTVVQHDPNGVPFRSDASLYMSYSYDNCSDRFSPEQIEAMRNNLYTEHSDYLQETQLGTLVPDDVLAQLVAPIDTEIVQYNNFTLNWTPVPNATYYHVQIAILANFQPIVLSTMVHDASSLTVNRNNFPKNSILYWRVRPYNEWDVCPSSTSQIGIFRTRDLSSVTSISNIAELSISPNPVTPGAQTMLTVINDGTTDLQVSIIDATGRLCHTISGRAYDGLENIFDLHTETLQAGTYFARIQTESGSAVKQFVVVE